MSLRGRTPEKRTSPFRAAAGGSARVAPYDMPFSRGDSPLTSADVFIICCFSNMKRRPRAARSGVGLRSVSRMTTMAAQLLDAKGLNCPLPILKAKKALKDVPVGGQLEVLATDPGSVADFQAFCRATGNELVESTQDRDVFRFVIRRCA